VNDGAKLTAIETVERLESLLACAHSIAISVESAIHSIRASRVDSHISRNFYFITYEIYSNETQNPKYITAKLLIQMKSRVAYTRIVDTFH
jgi:hypothetical protein